MANPIDIVISKEALAEIDKAISKVGALDKEIQSTAQSFISNSKKMASALSSITPVDVSESIADNSKLTAELERQNKIIQGLETQIKRLSQVRAETIKRVDEERLAEIKLQQDREKAFDKFEKQLALEGKAREKAIEMAKKQQLAEEKQAFSRREAFDKNTKKLEAQAVKELSTYNRIQTSVNSLTKTYNDLAIRKELGNTLSKNEEKQLVYLTNRIKTYQDALLKVDSTIGKHQRNVGNYASGFNGLGNSINQITRELPAFTFSAQTGFLALSNNIPILTDEIGKLVQKNKDLKASGQETTSVFKQILGSVFSLQTVMGIAILGFTLFGDKIVDFITGAEKSKKVLEAEKKAIEDRSKAMDEARTTLANYQGDEISRSKILLETAKNLSLSYKEREKAVKELQERYPEYLGGLSKEKILAGETADAEELLNTALVKRGVALAAQQEIQKVISDSLKNEKKLADELLNIETKRKEINSKFGSGDVFAKEGSESKKMADERNLQLGRLFYLEQTINEQYTTRKSTIQESLKFYLDQYNQNAKFLDVVKETNTVTKKSKEEESEAQRGTEKWYNQQIAKLKEIQSATADTTKEYKDFTRQIEALEKALELLRNGNKFVKPSIGDTSGEAIPSTAIDTKSDADPNEWMKQYAKDVADAEAEMKALKEATDNWLNSFSSEFLQNSGMGSLETFFDGTFDKLLEGAETTEEKFAVTFNAIAESAQEMFNFISNASQANFDAEYARLESQKDVALKFAGDSATSKKKIEEDYEKKKKEIANRENKAKQKQAIFNIAIDTAQAIVGLWAKPGFPAAIPLAIAVGALGAAQIGMVATQKIPQYFDGGVHGGGLAMINDAGGSNYVETVVTPDGKVQQFKGRDVVTDLPKGTEIFTPEQWASKELEYMLNSRGVMLSNQASKGFTAEQMDAILAKHFGKIQTNTTVFDKKGIMQFSEMNGNKTIRNANRATGLGFKI